jgi:hypothetical protein
VEKRPANFPVGYDPLADAQTAAHRHGQLERAEPIHSDSERNAVR